MVYLGIDWGQSKIGLAIAEDGLVQPLEVLESNKNLLGRLSRLCQEQLIGKIIIGLPEGKLEKEVKKFGQKLAKLSSLPVEFEPEILTTQEAIAKMIQAGKRQKARKKKEDAFAAALILQSYLEKNV